MYRFDTFISLYKIAVKQEIADVAVNHNFMKILSRYPNRDAELRAVHAKVTKDNRGTPTAYSTQLLIEYYGKNCRLYETTKKFYEEVKNLGMIPDTSLLTALARAFEESREVEYIKYVIAEVKAHHVPWTSELGNAIFNGLYLCKCSRSDLVDLQAELMKHGLHLDQSNLMNL